MLGNAGKKLGTMIELAEDLYEKMTELREQLVALRDTAEDTHDRVVSVQEDLDRQRALLEAVASEQGIDPDEVLEDAEPATDDPEEPA